MAAMSSEVKASERVDVIIPAYNNAAFLKRAVNSVLDQTHHNLRLVVVDDGSTDDTATVMAEVTDERVRFVSKDNGGPSSARNFGLTYTTAPFIAYLDADDVWRSDKLERQLALFSRRPGLGMVYCSQQWIDPDGNDMNVLEAAKRGQIFDDLLTGNVITGSASAVVIRREALEKAGQWREDIRIGEDWELWMRIARDYEVDFVPEALISVRKLPTSAQHNFLRVAQDHERLLPIIVEEFELSRDQRRAIECTSAWLISVHYYMGGRPEQARRAMVSFLRTRPVYALDYRHWDMLARIFIGTKILRMVFGTGARPTMVRTGLRRLKRLVKGAA